MRASFILSVCLIVMIFIGCNSSPTSEDNSTKSTADTANSASSQQVTLLSVHPRFHINDDDKDWNTQAILKVQYQGRDIARLECCSADRSGCAGDTWCDGADIGHGTNHALPEMRVIERIPKTEIMLGSYFIGFTAVGNDRVRFNATLTAVFSDNTQQAWSFNSQELESRGGRIDARSYPLR